MSDHHHAHAGHGHHGHDDHENHGSIKDYTIGFILSVILTAIPFWLVMGGPLENSQTVTAIIVAFAAVQVIVHMVYFLHMNGKAEGGWTMLSTLFTVVVLVIMLAGSIWVMYHMNTNMMPQMDHNVTAPIQAPTSTITPEQAAPVQGTSAQTSGHGGH